MSKYGVISGPYFPVFGLNTEIYGVNICIQSEYRKMRTRNNSVFGHFSRSDIFACGALSSYLISDAFFRPSSQEVFSGKYILKICSNFTGEHPCQSVISITLLKSHFYSNHTSSWVFSCKFSAYFQNTFS